jgi:hypothetical protein
MLSACTTKSDIPNISEPPTESETESVGSEDEADHYIVDVKVLTWPTKNVYLPGEKIDLSGLTLEVTWEDGYIETVDHKHVSCNMSTYVEGTTELILTYAGFDFRFVLSGEVDVDGIQVVKNPYRTAYVVGEYFNPTGLEVRYHKDGVPFGSNIEFDYSPKTALTISDNKIIIKVAQYTVDYPIEVSNGVSIETEAANEIVGGEVATSGMVAGYASGKAMTRNFGEGDTMKFLITATEDVTSNIYIVGASACVSEYVDGVPLVTEDMQLNRLLTLKVNNQEIEVGDEAIFKGETFETADFKNLANWTNVYLNKVNLVKGDNEILFTFKKTPYSNEDKNKSPASPFYDKMMFSGDGISHNTGNTETPDVPDVPDEPELPELTATTKIEAENMEISGITKAGNTSLHPGYANSGVSSNYSNEAFVKNFNTGGYLKYTCKVSKDTSISLNLAGSPTSTDTAVDLKNIFDLYINDQKVTINGDATYAASSTAWLVRDGDFGNYDVPAGTLEIEFKIISSTESIFVDYLRISTL